PRFKPLRHQASLDLPPLNTDAAPPDKRRFAVRVPTKRLLRKLANAMVTRARAAYRWIDYSGYDGSIGVPVLAVAQTVRGYAPSVGRSSTWGAVALSPLIYEYARAMEFF